MLVVAGVVVLLCVFLFIVWRHPDSFTVERSLDIAARPEVIRPHIDHFGAWQAWSPFEKLDRNMKKTLSGPESGQGAIYEWSGNSKAGAGRMEVVHSSAAKVSIRLEYTRPFRNHSNAEFTLKPVSGGTNVTWTVQGPVPFAAKIFHLFLDMDKLMGREFASGLASLKDVVEKTAKASAAS